MERHPDLPTHVAIVGIVDDDPAVRNSLKFLLEIDGFAVGIYGNAHELLTDGDLSRFHCFVIDQYMPGLGGLDLAVELREKQIPVPVILITTHPSKALVARAAQMGVPIVEKPLLGNALLEKIHDLAARPMPPNVS
jgi:FixJ family two-component response regulator